MMALWAAAIGLHRREWQIDKHQHSLGFKAHYFVLYIMGTYQADSDSLAGLPLAV
jgi:hypothetical protein